MACLQSLTGPAIAPSPLTKIEQERLERIESNRRRMEELGVLETARSLLETINASKPKREAKPRTFKPKGPRPRPETARRSARLIGERPKYGEIKDDYDGVGDVTYSDYTPADSLDDLLAGDDDVSSWEPAKQEQFQELRCNSVARGSMYDQVVGITCHFCRQKKLCGEDGCPRCSRRNGSADCIGKTECARCQGATGRFCRACLLLRYGEKMEDAQAKMRSGQWLCPHCYEEEHPHEGWMCNSSICMKRRGYKPTGIAIYDAQQRGFASVAHWLQAQLKKRAAGDSVPELEVDEAAVAKSKEAKQRRGKEVAAGGEGGDGAAEGGARKRGRPRKEAAAAEAAEAAAEGDGRRRTRASAAVPAAPPMPSKAKSAAASSDSSAAAAADAADAAPSRDARKKSPAAAAGPKPSSLAKAAAAKAAAVVITEMAAAAAAAGKTRRGKGADQCAQQPKAAASKDAAKSRAKAASAGASREGSSEPFAPLTPAKRGIEPVEAGGECGARRALRPRRI